MPPIQTFIAIALTFFCGCKNSTSVTITNEKQYVSWLSITIQSNSEEFSIFKNADSMVGKLVSNSLNSMDSVITYPFSSSEKDSLFEWSELIVESKQRPKTLCTDYYGKLTVRITYNEQVRKEIRFSSICEWKDINENASKIYQLISQKQKSK